MKMKIKLNQTFIHLTLFNLPENGGLDRRSLKKIFLQHAILVRPIGRPERDICKP
jgi:hypothetical protein